MTEAVSATQIGAWKVGYDHRSKMAVIVFEFTDRPPIPFVIPIEDASRLARALLALDTPGQSSPHRPN